MITAAELSLLKSADPGVKFPGVDTPVGNPLATASLKSISSLSTNSSAPIFYDAKYNRVIVKQAGAVLSGYNFGSATVSVNAPNVTIEDCTFTEAAPLGSSVTAGGQNGLTVENCTFQGGNRLHDTWIATGGGYTTITNNAFIDTPDHGVQISNGVISNNYFSGGGYAAGSHSDAIQIGYTTGPITISGNFIDWTNNPDAAVATNNTIRIANDNGNTSNVTVTGNVLLGGAWSVIANPSTIGYLGTGATGTLGATGTMTNIAINGNYFGWAGGAFYPGAGAGVSTSGNTIVDYTNPVYAANAWSAYVAAGGVKTQYLVQSTGGNIAGNSSGTSTLYGGAYKGALVAQGQRETVFVGGSGAQIMNGGGGADIFQFLSVGDSPGNGGHGILGNFDPAKDVIDLSAINSNPGNIPGASPHLTFIGTSPFTAAGDEVRYTYDAQSNMTLVEFNLAGDDNAVPDFVLRVGGRLTLTAANFALTSDQSAADLAAGAALSASNVRSGNAIEYLYTNVVGRSYASYQSIQFANGVAADDLNLNSGAGEIDLYQNGATITRGGAKETFAIGTASFKLPYHAAETIQAANSGADTFAFASGFGTETINGFVATGANADKLQLSISAFSYLNPIMTQAQDLAAVLKNATTSATGVTIADSAGDSLTLTGVDIMTLASNPAAVTFV